MRLMAGLLPLSAPFERTRTRGKTSEGRRTGRMVGTWNDSWADCVTAPVNYYNLPANGTDFIFRNQSPADVIVILIISGTRRNFPRRARPSRFALPGNRIFARNKKKYRLQKLSGLSTTRPRSGRKKSHCKLDEEFVIKLSAVARRTHS